MHDPASRQNEPHQREGDSLMWFPWTAFADHSRFGLPRPDPQTQADYRA
jgi:hypothetical protein